MKLNSENVLERGQWQDVVAPNKDTQLVDFELFNNHLVYEQRRDGLSIITIRELSSGKEIPLKFYDTAFAAYLSGNEELGNPNVRIYHSSLTTPGTFYDFDLSNGQRTLLKQTPVLGDFNADNYQSERIMVQARDGKQIPVSLVYRKDMFKKMELIQSINMATALMAIR